MIFITKIFKYEENEENSKDFSTILTSVERNSKNMYAIYVICCRELLRE